MSCLGEGLRSPSDSSYSNYFLGVSTAATTILLVFVKPANFWRSLQFIPG